MRNWQKAKLPNKLQVKMQNHDSKFKILVFLLSILYFLFSIPVFAANPQFLVSWKAESYVPAWYGGKVFPAKGSPVIVSFELVDNGKITDLSRTVVRWYVNGKLVKNEKDGLGIKSLSLTAPGYGGQEVEVRITLPDYRGTTLDQIARIPVKSPEVIIDGRFGARPIQAGDNSFEAMPFFFNAKNLDGLSFNWLANGQTAQANSDTPWLLNLNIDSSVPSGFPINLRLIVQNSLNQMEFSSRDIQLQVGK